MRCGGLFSCSKTWVYSSAVMMAVECFFRWSRALWGESVVRKEEVLGEVRSGGCWWAG
jgi:hypothetical protein